MLWSISENKLHLMLCRDFSDRTGFHTYRLEFFVPKMLHQSTPISLHVTKDLCRRLLDVHLNASAANYREHGGTQKPTCSAHLCLYSPACVPRIIQITSDLSARIMWPIIRRDVYQGPVNAPHYQRNDGLRVLTWQTLTGLVFCEWRETMRRCRSRRGIYWTCRKE